VVAHIFKKLRGDNVNVLSLFDGISCGQVALKRSGIKVKNYFASEIDKYAIKVTMANHPDTKQLGDITKLSYKDGVLYSENGEFEVGKIDLVMGGSPCQGFSTAGKMLNFEDPRSKLFFEFVRLVKECNPKYFLLENVKMKKEWVKVISDKMGVEPIEINSALVSAQNRKRLYWTNISNVTQPNDRKLYLNDVLEREVDDKYFLSNKMVDGFLNSSSQFRERFKPFIEGEKKARCLTARYFKMGKSDQYVMQINPCKKSGGKQPRMQDRIYFTRGCKSPALTSFYGRLNVTGIISFTTRRLTPTECERLQTLSDNYTDHVSDTQRYKTLGNAWTVDVVAHIFKNILWVLAPLG
jgi:DNA-cytosine methyltransferase